MIELINSVFYNQTTHCFIDSRDEVDYVVELRSKERIEFMEKLINGCSSGDWYVNQHEILEHISGTCDNTKEYSHKALAIFDIEFGKI